MISAFLIWVGIIRRKDNGSIRWPLYIAPKHVWQPHLFPKAGKRQPFITVFRNLPHVIKWQEGRLLPRRWGVSLFGVLEFGDRG